MSEGNVVEMPVRKNILGGTIHIFKTKEQMETDKVREQEGKDATKEISD